MMLPVIESAVFVIHLKNGSMPRFNAIFSVATVAVEVGSLRFSLCASLKSQTEAIAQLPSPSDGYDLYRKAALSFTKKEEGGGEGS